MMVTTGDSDAHLASFPLPAGSCDAHCHVFGPADRFPFSPDRKYEPEDSPRERLAALHEALGIERAVIVQASAHGTDNRAMLDALAWRPDRYRGVAIINDSFDDRALAGMREVGVRGVRFNFVQSLGGYPDMGMFARVIERIRPLGWHVVLHLRGEDILALDGVIRALPVPFVIDHMGRMDVTQGLDQPAFRLLTDLLRHGDGWVKVSGAERMARFPHEEAIPFARTLVENFPDRVLWGTDFPHPNLAETVDETELVRLIPRYAPTPEARHRLLVANPAALYGFEA